MRLIREEKTFIREAVLLMLPMILQNFVTFSMSMADTFMVGVLGETALAAVTMANSPFYVMQLMIFGVQSGMSVLVAQYHGRGDQEAINRVMGIALFVSTTITGLLAITAFCIPEQIMRVLTNNADLVAPGAAYTRYVGFSYFFSAISGVYIAAQRSTENPRLGAVLLTVSTAGLPVAVSKLVSEANALNRRNQVRRTFRLALVLFLTLGLISFLVMFFRADALAGMMNDSKAAAGIRALAPAVVCVGCLAALRGYSQGHSNMAPTSVSQIIEALCKLFLGLGLAWLVMNRLGDGPLAAAGSIAGVTIGTVLSALYLFCKTRRRTRELSRAEGQARPAGETLKRLLAIAVPITLGAAGLQIINLFDAATVMNRLINAAGYTQERADVVKGVYNYCQTIFNFPCAFIPCITIAIIPAITNSLTLQDRRGVRSVQNSSLRLMGLIAMPCAVGLIVLAEPIVALLGGYTGANLTLATKLMAILGVAVVFNSIVLMTDAIMQAHNHAVIPVINTLIGGIVKVIVNYILVGNPDIAITGAPVGTIACYAVITVLNLIAMRRVLRRNAPKLLPNLWKTTIAAVLMGGATWLAYWGLGRIGMGRAVACLGSIVVAVLVYVVLIIVLKVLTYEDCLLLPKGEKIAKILRVR